MMRSSLHSVFPNSLPAIMPSSNFRVRIITACTFLWTAVFLTDPALADLMPTREMAKVDFRRPASIPFPTNNPYSKAKEELGRHLFFDPILSSSGARSCATCHNPSLSWGDGLARAIGENQQILTYRTPTILNMAWLRTPGWFGKFSDLESVAFTPINSPKLMNRKTPELISALSMIPSYRALFAKAFEDGAITKRNIELALATYQRTIVSGPAPFDRWVAGNEQAISESAKRGFDLFRGKADCAECHRGWNFTDGAFYDIGTDVADLGRGKLFPTSTKMKFAYKVPTLRDTSRRAPYMHNGSIKNLNDVIELYDKGGIDRPSRSELIKPLRLSASEKMELIAFLETLTSDPVEVKVPFLPR
jgi:cytochrome c peroxidase